ncbi:nucleotidyltransferase domain-containing protein [Microbacterium sp. Root180]|uniref:nucleotidyltransferase domain-containing protein n=1 Tax=Microbacterium sp. Root180 TaxID=1736483 RepID=UPI0009EC59D9|nr:nucleotidyltransferase domain-containing protein [Microbacterium sp. Root180]
MIFDAADRARIRDELLRAARADPDIAGAALVGSAARGAEDRWSDIDLVLQLARGADEAAVVERWTSEIRDRFGIADTLDVFAAENVRYRVFLLPTSLQIDVSFWPHDLFRETEAGFALQFGTAAAPTRPPARDPRRMIGMGWLYALHARSALARGKVWQAAMMLDDLRDEIVALQCLRAGLNPWHGRDVDRLAAASLSLLEQSRAPSLNLDELDRSKRALLALFHDEVGRHDPALADALAPAVSALAERP